MEGKGSISAYRNKLDRTLASPDLSNDETLQTLVKNQILQSSHLQFEEHVDSIAERRSKELSNFLRMLRSTSENDVEGSKSNGESQGGWKLKHDTEEFRVMYREGPEGAPYHTLLVEGYVDGPLDVCLCISWESGLYKNWWPQTAIPTFKVVSSKCLQKVRNGEQISLVRMKVSWPLSSREALIHYYVFEYFQDDLLVVLLNSISDSETIDRTTHGFTRDGVPDADDVVRIDVVGGLALQKVAADRSYFRTIANMDIKLDFVPPAFINFISRQLVGSGFKLYKKEVASVSKGDEKFRDALTDPLYAHIREALYSINTKTSGDDNGENKEVINVRDDQTDIGTEGEKALRRSNEGKKVPISPKVEQALETLDKAISIFRDQNTMKLTETLEKEHDHELNSLGTGISSGNHASRQKELNSCKRETKQSKIVPDEDLLPNLCSSMNQQTISGNKMTKRKNKRSRFCCLHFYA